MGRHCIRWGLLGIAAAGLMMCGTRMPLPEPTPGPTAPSRIDPLPPPTERLPVVVPEERWTPVSYASDQGAELSGALKRMKTIALVLPQKGDPATLENRVFKMVKAAAPETRIAVRGKADLRDFLNDSGGIPLRLTGDAGSDGKTGAAYTVPRDHPLSLAFLKKKRALNGADGLLVVRPVTVSEARLATLRERKTGSCEAFESTLREGYDTAKSACLGFEEKASAALAKEFSRHLKTALPFWRAELDEFAAIAETDSKAARCQETYAKLLDRYERCLDKTCPFGPKLFADHGGIVGMPDPAVRISDDCPVSGMRDYAREISDLADRAVVEVMPAMDRGWAGELLRLASVDDVVKLVRDECAPRHRRIVETALVDARAAVSDFLRRVKKRRYAAVWESVGGMEHVPGEGPVNVFARAKLSVGNPVADVTGLKTAFRKIDRCDAQDDRVFQAAVVDVATSEVIYMGFFFEENLLCDDLPPK